LFFFYSIIKYGISIKLDKEIIINSCCNGFIEFSLMYMVFLSELKFIMALNIIDK